MQHYFVTGTDTGVGKTYLTQRILEHLRNTGKRVIGYKPVCCGDRDDAEILAAASSGGPSLETINPIWYRNPSAPLAAALIENRPLEMNLITEGFSGLVAAGFDHILVEGIGGWKVPITAELTVADFAQELGLPIIVVANNRLGTLNHTILTVESILAAGLRCASVILNHVSDERDAASISNLPILRERFPFPVIDFLHGETQIDLSFIISDP